MHIKKLLLLLLTVGASLPGCEEPYCDADRRYRDVEGVALTAYSGPSNPAAANAAVWVGDLVLEFGLQTRSYGALRPRGGFTAVADCRFPEYTERVDSLIITSRYDYDAQHPAGTPLNNLMGMFSTPSALEPLSPDQLNGQRLSIQQRPAASGPQQFRVRYHQTNGEVYTAETVVLNVLR